MRIEVYLFIYLFFVISVDNIGFLWHPVVWYLKGKENQIQWEQQQQK